MKQNNCERKMNLREAAQQALEALCLPCDRWNRRQTEIINASITALRTALAEDAMERLTDVQQEMDCYGDGNVYRGQRSSDSKTPTLTINGMPAVEGPLSKSHRTCQESRQVEPVAWAEITRSGKLYKAASIKESAERKAQQQIDKLGAEWKCSVVPLYTAPPKRKPLTQESLENLFLGNDSNDWWRLELKEFVNVARAIERAHDIGE